MSAFTSIGDAISAPFRAAASSVKVAFDSIVNAASNAWQKVKDFFGSIGSAASSAWNSITSDLPFSANPAMAAVPAVAAYTPYRVIDPDAQGRSSGLPLPRAALLAVTGRQTTQRPVTVDRSSVTINVSGVIGDKRDVMRYISRGLREYEHERGR